MNQLLTFFFRKIKSNKLKTVLIIGLLVSALGASNILFTKSAYSDRDMFKKNILGSSEVELILKVSETKHNALLEENSYLLTKELSLINGGDGAFRYSLSAENFSGDEELCNDLNLKLFLLSKNEELYNSKLRDLKLNLNNELDVMSLDLQDKHKYLFAVYVSDDFNGAEKKQECSFDLFSDAWKQNFSIGDGYTDVENLSFSVKLTIDDPSKLKKENKPKDATKEETDLEQETIEKDKQVSEDNELEEKEHGEDSTGTTEESETINNNSSIRNADIKESSDSSKPLE